MKNHITAIIIIFLSQLAHANSKNSDFSEDNICIAAIATINLRNSKGIKVLSNKNKTITVAYTRNDGKIFGYSCQIKNSEIRWKDKTMNRWNKNIKVYYSVSVNGKKLNIQSVAFGDTIRKVFTKSDF